MSKLPAKKRLMLQQHQNALLLNNSTPPPPSVAIAPPSIQSSISIIPLNHHDEPMDEDEEINVHDDDSPLDMRITKHDSDSGRPSVIRRAPSFKETNSNSPSGKLVREF